MVKKNACEFISGQGTNLRSLINFSRYEIFPVNIKLVVSNKMDAKGIFYAKKNSIPYIIIDTKKRNFENIILNELKKYKISLICLAGYMKVVSKKETSLSRKELALKLNLKKRKEFKNKYKRKKIK